ncbi:hypothetical protein BC831DRAFT_440274 [Entophlyctis helioformis]|nr:hypothetical protein BC831DRAFT_440274 [Entophlyctis helioformis]
MHHCHSSSASWRPGGMVRWNMSILILITSRTRARGSTLLDASSDGQLMPGACTARARSAATPTLLTMATW